jgi:hypothetical protein
MAITLESYLQLASERFRFSLRICHNVVAAASRDIGRSYRIEVFRRIEMRQARSSDRACLLSRW